MEIIPDTKCQSNDMGLWMIEPLWFQRTINAITNGAWKIESRVSRSSSSELFHKTEDGVAIVQISGPMVKGFSFFGGTSTVQVRNALRAAASDKSVDSILLNIDSPGGHVAGTMELANDVRSINAIKPVQAHIEDLGASAAFWVASQSSRITANATAEIGSIGTVAVVEDASKMFEKAGIKVHVVSTGEHKGAFTFGSEVTKDQLKDLQVRINDLNEHFVNAVSRGRGLSGERLESVTDGRVHIASKALDLGLIDGVQSIEATIGEMANSSSEKMSNAEKGKRRMSRSMIDIQKAKN